FSAGDLKGLLRRRQSNAAHQLVPQHSPQHPRQCLPAQRILISNQSQPSEAKGVSPLRRFTSDKEIPMPWPLCARISLLRVKKRSWMTELVGLTRSTEPPKLVLSGKNFPGRVFAGVGRKCMVPDRVCKKARRLILRLSM